MADTPEYRIYYHGAPYLPGEEGHVEYRKTSATVAARKWRGLGELLRRERTLVEVRGDEVCALTTDDGRLMYVEGGYVE